MKKKKSTDVADITDTEHDVLMFVLAQLRHAIATNEHLSVHLDPFHRAHGHGVIVIACHSATGRYAEFVGQMRLRRLRKRRSQ